MKPELINKNEFKVIGMKITCDWSKLHTEMPKLWKSFNERIGEIDNIINDCTIDICLQVVENDFTQLICVEVSDLSNIPEGMTGMVIPSQSYAYLKHEGPVEDIWKSFGALQSWIKETGLTIDPLDFKMDYCPKDPVLPHELYEKVI